MSIVTKQGDRGKTRLFWGGEIAKDHPRVELQGTLDELGAHLGLARCLVKSRVLKEILIQIQRQLFIVGAEVATRPLYLKKLKKRIGGPDVVYLERVLLSFERKKGAVRPCFSVPGADLASSYLHVARTLARRAERRAVALAKKKGLKNSDLLRYLNRLSDLVFIMAAACERKP